MRRPLYRDDHDIVSEAKNIAFDTIVAPRTTAFTNHSSNGNNSSEDSNDADSTSIKSLFEQFAPRQPELDESSSSGRSDRLLTEAERNSFFKPLRMLPTNSEFIPQQRNAESYLLSRPFVPSLQQEEEQQC